MILAHYANRPPKNYDLEFIRELIRERAPIWDARPDLYFKAFMLREAGRLGAIANSFSSLYLWRHDVAYRDWLVSGGYKIVTDPFHDIRLYYRAPGYLLRGELFDSAVSEAYPGYGSD